MNINNKKPAKSILANCRTALIALVCAATLTGCGWLKGEEGALAPDVQVIESLGCLVTDELNDLVSNTDDAWMKKSSIAKSDNVPEFKTKHIIDSMASLRSSDDPVYGNVLDLRNRCGARLSPVIKLVIEKKIFISGEEWGKYNPHHEGEASREAVDKSSAKYIVGEFCRMDRDQLSAEYFDIKNKFESANITTAADLACTDPKEFKNQVDKMNDRNLSGVAQPGDQNDPGASNFLTQ